MDGDSGVFLTLKDCSVLFPRFKTNEAFLSDEERVILLRMEKVIYGNLSIQEVEDLLDKGLSPSASGISRRN